MLLLYVISIDIGIPYTYITGFYVPGERDVFIIIKMMILAQ